MAELYRKFGDDDDIVNGGGEICTGTERRDNNRD